MDAAVIQVLKQNNISYTDVTTDIQSVSSSKIEAVVTVTDVQLETEQLIEIIVDDIAAAIEDQDDLDSGDTTNFIITTVEVVEVEIKVGDDGNKNNDSMLFIIIGSIFCGILLIIICWLCFDRCSKKQATSDSEGDEELPPLPTGTDTTDELEPGVSTAASTYQVTNARINSISGSGSGYGVSNQAVAAGFASVTVASGEAVVQPVGNLPTVPKVASAEEGVAVDTGDGDNQNDNDSEDMYDDETGALGPGAAGPGAAVDDTDFETDGKEIEADATRGGTHR